MIVATRLRAVVGLAAQQLRRTRLRTILAVIGVALAVLAATLLASTGYGVVQTGQEKFTTSGRDLWVTGGPVQITPGSVGSFQSSLHDAHDVATHIQRDEHVSVAAPMLFQTVYIGNSTENLDTIVGVGVPGVSDNAAHFTAGGGFEKGDVHYADGNYTGPITHHVIIDPRLAATYNLSVGDTVHIGGTVSQARRTTYTVVGISPTFSNILGTPTATIHLSELQSMTGAERTDQATFITITTRDGANVTAVQHRIQEEYPQYDVRTNREELQAVLADKIIVIASGLTLVILAIIAGLALTINILTLLVYQQRQSLAALRAAGISATTLAGVVASQGVLIGLLGGLLGLALTPLAATVLNAATLHLVGFHDLIRTPPWVYYAGAIIAVIIGAVSAAIAGWQVTRVNPLQTLTD